MSGCVGVSGVYWDSSSDSRYLGTRRGIVHHGAPKGVWCREFGDVRGVSRCVGASGGIGGLLGDVGVIWGHWGYRGVRGILSASRNSR